MTKLFHQTQSDTDIYTHIIKSHWFSRVVILQEIALETLIVILVGVCNAAFHCELASLEDSSEFLFCFCFLYAFKKRLACDYCHRRIAWLRLMAFCGVEFHLSVLFHIKICDDGNKVDMYKKIKS